MDEIQPCRHEPAGYQDEPQGKVAKLRHRASQTLRGIHRKNTGGRSISNAMVVPSRRNLILSAICGRIATPFHADVFIARLVLRGNRSKTTRTDCHSRQNCHYLP